MNDDEFMALANKDPMRAKCEISLFEFVKQAWHLLHKSVPLTTGWCLEVMCEHLQAVTEGEITRLLINVPPGTAKSMLTSCYWPAWEWGPRGMPHLQYITASYDKRLSTRDMMNMRDMISSEWYQSRWPIKWKDDDRGKEKYSNMDRGFRYATSTGAGLTGWRGQRFIIDDPHSVAEAESDTERQTARFWFAETTPTRFTDQKKPVYVVIMQRLHGADISGLIMEKLMEEQDWTVLVLPMEANLKYRSWTPVYSPYGRQRMRRVMPEGDACPHFVRDDKAPLLYCQDPRTEEGELLFPERFDRKTVDDLKVQLMVEGGEYACACQLDQRPVPREGGMFKADRISLVEEPLEGYPVRGWDLAASKDKTSPYTASARLIMGTDGQLCIANVTRIRGDADEVRKHVQRTAAIDGLITPQDIPQDPGQAGKAQVAQFAKDLHGHECYFSPESGAKEQRAEPFAAQVNAGNVCMVKAPWNEMVLAELGMFPGSRFKDITDALSRAYHRHLKAVDDPVSLFGPRLLMPDKD